MQELPADGMSSSDAHFPVSTLSDDRLRQAVQILTTEHSNLQSGRASTVTETNGRVTVFFATASSALIAIAFVGQISALGGAFRVFTLLLPPALLFLGIMTLVRVTQSSIEDRLYVSGINRIRHFYVELVPELADYFVLSTHDDQTGWLASMGLRRSRWQPVLGIGSMVAAVNSIIIGTLAALVSSWFGEWGLTQSAALGLLSR